MIFRDFWEFCENTPIFEDFCDFDRFWGIFGVFWNSSVGFWPNSEKNRPLYPFNSDWVLSIFTPENPNSVGICEKNRSKIGDYRAGPRGFWPNLTWKCPKSWDFVGFLAKTAGVSMICQKSPVYIFSRISNSPGEPMKQAKKGGLFFAQFQKRAKIGSAPQEKKP